MAQQPCESHCSPISQTGQSTTSSSGVPPPRALEQAVIKERPMLDAHALLTRLHFT